MSERELSERETARFLLLAAAALAIAAVPVFVSIALSWATH
jgi:hypothetical protein